MKKIAHEVLACSLLGLIAVTGYAQAPFPPQTVDPHHQRAAPLEQRLAAISDALAATQKQLDQSQRQVQQLQQELQLLSAQIAGAGPATAVPSDTQPSALSGSTHSPEAPATAAASIEERQQALEAAVKLHDQVKVESGSKYPVRLTGLILFNGYLNKGVPDNTDLPGLAAHQTATSGNGSVGASFRQTILGIEGDGPRIAGARTSANVFLDFFSGVSYSNYGTSAGVVRMRTATIDLNWEKDLIQVGMAPPLISPLSPSSYATVAEPSLAGAGNLWTWAPQLRFKHQLKLRGGNHVALELGLWDAPAAGYNSNQLFRTASPAELSKQPAYETRISYGTPGEHGLQLGAGGYYSREAYPGYQGYAGTESVDSWAGTLDWRIPFAGRFEISGEGYRGRSVGGLGGGVYKDVIAGTDPITGEKVMRPLNAIGGWTQIKGRFGSSLETNISIGQDDGFARDFHSVVLSPTASATQLRARNRMAVVNLIFKPKTYIIFSPEYRRIWTWPINGEANTVDVFTLALGYQF